jgi:serine/threonine-protein phosphatase 2A regulatory subunit A
MKKGDSFSMRISATFLYAYIYSRLDNEKQSYVRKKFQKLAKDDTPMVRRGAATSISIISESLNPEHASEYLLPILKDLLKDENDSVKIHAVYSSITVAKIV